jgi:hypothetical protein
MLAKEAFLRDGQLVKRELQLRENAQVMLLRNTPCVGVNGSRGVLVRMSSAAREYNKLVTFFEKKVLYPFFCMQFQAAFSMLEIPHYTLRRSSQCMGPHHHWQRWFIVASQIS